MKLYYGLRLSSLGLGEVRQALEVWQDGGSGGCVGIGTRSSLPQDVMSSLRAGWSGQVTHLASNCSQPDTCMYMQTRHKHTLTHSHFHMVTHLHTSRLGLPL